LGRETLAGDQCRGQRGAEAPRHKTAVLTLDRYGHLFPDDLDAVATAFDAAAQSAVDQLRTGRLLKIASSPE